MYDEKVKDPEADQRPGTDPPGSSGKPDSDNLGSPASSNPEPAPVDPPPNT